MAMPKICSVEGCDKRIRSRGLCNAHYAMYKKHGDPEAKFDRRTQYGKCRMDGCGSEANSGRDWLCGSHYKRKWRYGDPLAGPRGRRAKDGEPALWLYSHAAHTGEECLQWPFAHRGNGYGILTAFSGKVVSAHREMCEAAHGKPPSLEHIAAHSCGNGHKGCVNPRHLRWATQLENAADRIVHGTEARGERNAHAKLTEEGVKEIRALWPAVSQNELARRFSVTQCTVWRALHRKSWAWL